MIKNAFYEDASTVESTRHYMRAIGAFIAATEFEQATGTPPGYSKVANLYVSERDRATCIIGARIFRRAGEDCHAMPTYYMIKSAGDGTIRHESLIAECAGYVRRGMAKVLIEEQQVVKAASTGLAKLFPFISRGSEVVPDTAKLLLGLGVGIGSLGGGALWYANDQTGKETAKVEALKRQADIYRRMREEVDNEAKAGGLLNVDVT